MFSGKAVEVTDRLFAPQMVLSPKTWSGESENAMKLINTKTILVPTDFSTSSWKSLRIAAMLATRIGMKVCVLHVLSSDYSPLFEILQPGEPKKIDISAYQDQVKILLREKALEQLADFPDAAAMTIEPIILTGNPARQILKVIHTTRPDLVVMGTRGQSDIMSLFIGGCAEQVIQKSSRPILVVPQDMKIQEFLKPSILKRTKPVGEAVVKILLPTDFSSSSVHALHYALELCQLLPASLYVLHVIEHLSLSDSLPTDEDMVEIAAKKKEVINFLDREMGLERCKMINISVCVGDPTREILTTCSQEQIDLVVMGTQGRNWLERFLLGSTTEAIISRSPCPVMTVRGATKVDIIEDRFQKIKQTLTPYELQSELKSFHGESEEENTFLIGKETPDQASQLFLGFYSPSGLKNGMEQYGISKLLKARGFEPLTYLTDTRNPYHQIVRIYHGREEDPNHVLVEIAVHEEVLNVAEQAKQWRGPRFLHFLAVDWVLIQNTQATQFDRNRPRLPGQQRPGLGIGYEIFAILVMVTERLKKDGLISRPEHYHNAFLYHERCRFLDPVREGTFLAISRDTASFSLPEVSWAIEKGFVIDEISGEPFSWFGDDLILPVHADLKQYFREEHYLEAMRNVLDNRRYIIDWERFSTVREQLLYPEIDITPTE